MRLMIQSALLFQVPYKDIREKLNVTDRQIRWAKMHHLLLKKEGDLLFFVRLSVRILKPGF